MKGFIPFLGSADYCLLLGVYFFMDDSIRKINVKIDHCAYLFFLFFQRGHRQSPT